MQSVCTQIQDDILSGHWPPGRKLRLNVLVDRYDTGTSPLREALNHLVAEGMVVHEENRGFHVAPANIEEWLELIRTRCSLEEVALRKSMANGDAAWEERVVLSFHRLSRSTQSKLSGKEQSESRWDEYHSEFHRLLISACNSGILIDFCAQLEKRTLRYRNLVKPADYDGHHDLDEHRELQQAVLDRNASLATRLLRKHYKSVSDNGAFKLSPGSVQQVL